MVKLTQLILHIGDEMNVEQKHYGYGQANIQFALNSYQYKVARFISNFTCQIQYLQFCKIETAAEGTINEIHNMKTSWHSNFVAGN